MTDLSTKPRAEKTDTGNGSNGICRAIDASRPPSPDPSRSAEKRRPTAMKSAIVIVAMLLTSCASKAPSSGSHKPSDRGIELHAAAAPLKQHRSEISPDGKFQVRWSRDHDGVRVPVICGVRSGTIVGSTDMGPRGFEHVLWSPDSRSVALVGDYSTPHREIRIYTLTDRAEFEQVEIDLPFPFGLYEKKNGGRGNFKLPRDDAYTLRWIDARTVRLLNISWEGADTAGSGWPKVWSNPVVGATFSVSIDGTQGKVSDVTLLGPMDYDDLIRKATKANLN